MDAILRFQRPTLPPAEAIERYLALSREERWFSNFGPCWRLLQARLTEATGRPCVPVASASLGLIVAIAALRHRAPPGAFEAIVPSFAHPASAQAAVWNGLTPVFADVSPDHWHVAPEALECALDERSERVAAVVALSTFGTPPPPEVRRRWQCACEAAGVPLVVDSAAGFGASAADGVPIGAQGDAEVVSFDAVKPLAAGEGGAVFLRDPQLLEPVTRLTHFGFDEGRRVQRLDGINAKMSEPAAAIVLAALDEYPGALAARRGLAASILEALPSSFELQAGSSRGTWQFVPVLAPDEDSRQAVLETSSEVVELRSYYDPLHEMPAFAAYARVGDLGATEDLGRRVLSLPMAVDLSDSEVVAVQGVLRKGARPVSLQP